MHNLNFNLVLNLLSTENKYGVKNKWWKHDGGAQEPTN